MMVEDENFGFFDCKDTDSEKEPLISSDDTKSLSNGQREEFKESPKEFTDSLPNGKDGFATVFNPGKVYDKDSELNDIDAMLHNKMIGVGIDREFPDSGLPDDHVYSWRSFEEDPKGDKGEVHMRGSWFKTMEYGVLHTGGFVRLCTSRGRVYWNAQNETGHVTPDWKLHFSVNMDDIGKAWNILAALFMEMKAEVGMKATYIPASEWSEGQRGREITVYIFVHNYSYKGYMQNVFPDIDHMLYLGPEIAIYESPYWISFILEAERRLTKAGIRSRGVADGDLGLPGCTFASLRNEAFVGGIYPPNNLGWNAANQPNPFLEVVFMLRLLQSSQKENKDTSPRTLLN
eukprot:m.296784 g.296784  ORF g.296784 m.296784 type:complete len:346 (+) comp16393_c8_seq4:154-1191(+)